MVFPMNLFLFGSIFYLVYKIIAGSDDEEELEGASEQSTVEETGEGDKEGDVVENVKSKIPGLKYLLVALAVIGLGEWMAAGGRAICLPSPLLLPRHTYRKPEVPNVWVTT